MSEALLRGPRALRSPQLFGPLSTMGGQTNSPLSGAIRDHSTWVSSVRSTTERTSCLVPLHGPEGPSDFTKKNVPFFSLLWPRLSHKFSFRDNCILLFSNEVDFHPALYFQEVFGKYLWNGPSTLKIEESRLQLFFNFVCRWVFPKTKCAFLVIFWPKIHPKLEDWKWLAQELQLLLWGEIVLFHWRRDGPCKGEQMTSVFSRPVH